MPTPHLTLQQDVNARHNRYWDDERLRSSGKKVILVEGDDDRTAIEAMLNATDTTWPTRVAVVVAGRRDLVLQKAENGTFSSAVGLVDRDVWSDPQVATITGSGRVYVTAGWCLENDLLVHRLPTDPPTLDAGLESVREPWIRAGALWWALQRTFDSFSVWRAAVPWTYGKRRDDLDLSSAAALVASLEARIHAGLRDAARLDLVTIGALWQQRLDEVRALSRENQWLRGVRGKSAYSEELVPLLNTAYGQRSSQAWRVARAGALARRPPFDALLARVL